MTKQVNYLSAYKTKEQLLTKLKYAQQELEATTDPLYKQIRQEAIADLQNVIDGFDVNAKDIKIKTDPAAIDYILNEGYDDEGNPYNTLDDYKKPHANIKKDNTPWQKGDNLNI